MAHHGGMVGQSDVLGLVMVRGCAAVEVRMAGAVWRGRALVHDEGALDVDLDAARVIDGAVDLGGGGGCPGPPNLLGYRDGVLLRQGCTGVGVGVGVGVGLRQDRYSFGHGCSAGTGGERSGQVDGSVVGMYVSIEIGSAVLRK